MDLVKSVSIENMVNQRAAVVGKIAQAAELMREAAQLAGAAHLGMPRVTISTSTSLGRGGMGERSLSDSYLHAGRAGETYKHDAAQREDVDKLIRLGVDAAAWQYLMHESGMRSLMDAKAREKWDRAISDGDIPELNEPNVRATFTMLHDSRGEIFERGVIACFKNLAWVYKTNLPQKFGKRIVMTYLAGSYGFQKCDQLDDLIRVLSVLDGNPEPDHRNGVYSMLTKGGITFDRRLGTVENDYLSIRCFKNGNGHVTFKRIDLIDKMNLIIAKHYPGALPAPK